MIVYSAIISGVIVVQRLEQLHGGVERFMGPFEMDGAREERGGSLREPDEHKCKAPQVNTDFGTSGIICHLGAIGAYKSYMMKYRAGKPAAHED